jgi:hypothetical protein
VTQHYKTAPQVSDRPPFLIFENAAARIQQGEQKYDPVHVLSEIEQRPGILLKSRYLRRLSMFTGRILALTLAFTVLIALATGVSCKGFFVQPTLTSLTINPTTPNVQVDTTLALQAFGVYSDGTSAYLTSNVSWSSSDPTVAAITGNCATAACGAATLSGVAVGTATITAGSQSVTSTATATTYITVSSLTIAPTTQSLATLDGTTADPFVVTAVTASGSIDISNVAVLTAYQNGAASAGILCSYNTSNPTGATGGPGIYCTGDDSEATGTYQLIATYTGTTLTATATLNVQ